MNKWNEVTLAKREAKEDIKYWMSLNKFRRIVLNNYQYTWDIADVYSWVDQRWTDNQAVKHYADMLVKEWEYFQEETA